MKNNLLRKKYLKFKAMSTQTAVMSKNQSAYGSSAVLVIATLQTFFVVLLTWLACPPTWDFYDGFVAHLVSGIATRGHLTNFYIYSYYGISTPLIWLQTHFSDIPWTGVLVISCLFIGNTLFNFLLLNTALKKWSGSILLAGFLLFPCIFLLQFQSFHQPNVAAAALLLSGSALLAAAEWQQGFNNKFLNAFIWLLLTIAVLLPVGLRFEAVLGTGLLTGIYAFFSSNPVWRLKRLLIPGVPALIGVAIIASSLNHVPFLKATEADLFIVADGSATLRDVTAGNSRDSIMEVAVKRFFLNDEQVLTPTFIHQLAERTIAAKQSAASDITHLPQRLFKLASAPILNHPQYVLFSLLIVLLSFFVSPGTGLRSLFFYLAFFLIMILLAYYIKLEDRHYVGLAQLFAYMQLLLFFSQIDSITPAFKFAFALTVLLAFFSFRSMWQQRTASEVNLKNLAEAEVEINQLSTRQVLLLDGDSKDIFHGTPFTLRHFDAASEIVFYDMGQMPILPEYRSYLDATCKCNSRNVVEFYDYLLSLKSNLCLISSEERVGFITTYLQLVHHKTIHLNRVNGDFALDRIERNNGKLHYYTLSQ
ncbi:MAG: hypothetical protein U0T75_15260 [Chitinophagales bacterium]